MFVKAEKLTGQKRQAKEASVVSSEQRESMLKMNLSVEPMLVHWASYNRDLSNNYRTKIFNMAFISNDIYSY
jgi:hypothetical protein